MHSTLIKINKQKALVFGDHGDWATKISKDDTSRMQVPSASLTCSKTGCGTPYLLLATFPSTYPMITMGRLGSSFEK